MNTLKKLGVVAAMVTSLNVAGQTHKTQKELHKTLKTNEVKHDEIEMRVIGNVPIEVHIPEEELTIKSKIKNHINIDETITREHILDQVVAQYSINYPNKQIIIDIEGVESLDRLINGNHLTKGTMLRFITTPEGVITRFVIGMSRGGSSEVSRPIK